MFIYLFFFVAWSQARREQSAVSFRVGRDLQVQTWGRSNKQWTAFDRKESTNWSTGDKSGPAFTTGSHLYCYSNSKWPYLKTLTYFGSDFCVFVIEVCMCLMKIWGLNVLREWYFVMFIFVVSVWSRPTWPSEYEACIEKWMAFLILTELDLTWQCCLAD